MDEEILSIGVHARSVGCQRRAGIEHAGERLVVHLDRLEGGLGEDLRLRRHERDGLALVPHPIGGQHGGGKRGEAEAGRILVQRVLGDIVRRQHGRHPREGAGLLHGDAPDPGGWIDGPENAPGQHPREAPVGGVERGPLHLVGDVKARQGPADDAEGRGGFGGPRHRYAGSPRASVPDPAQASIASTIRV